MLTMDGVPLIEGVEYTQTHNGTHNVFYITYNYSSHTVEIIGSEVISEFPPAAILLLFMMITPSVAITYRRNRHARMLELMI